ncbi:MAG TPA: hypothetical protein VED40_08230 [Azospirillaceae bacterium]|nr:hypothetical protein [Azospirillaceae bacterium]
MGFSIDELRDLMRMVEGFGYKPLLKEARDFLWKSAGIPEAAIADEYPSRRDISVDYMEAMCGELYVDGNSIAVLSAEGGFFSEHDFESLTVSFMSIDDCEIHAKFTKFSEAVLECARRVLKKRDEELSSLQWADRSSHEEADEEGNDEEEQFGRAVLESAYVVGAQAIAKSKLQKLLIEISQAGFARARDLLSRRRSGGAYKDALVQFSEAGVVRTDQVIECKANGSPLCRIDNQSEAIPDSVLNLVCVGCNRSYRSENFTEGYALTELGKKLVVKSHWLTVWATDQLVTLGIPLDVIKWNVHDGSEEVDIILDYYGKKWIFELKDKEFGGGDAHALNYRQVRYQADKAIIFTTEKISADAKKIFSEVSKQRLDDDKSVFVFVEGIENFPAVMGREFSVAAYDVMKKRVTDVGGGVGFKLAPIIEAKYEAYIIKQAP